MIRKTAIASVIPNTVLQMWHITNMNCTITQVLLLTIVNLPYLQYCIIHYYQHYSVIIITNEYFTDITAAQNILNWKKPKRIMKCCHIILYNSFDSLRVFGFFFVNVCVHVQAYVHACKRIQKKSQAWNWAENKNSTSWKCFYISSLCTVAKFRASKMHKKATKKKEIIFSLLSLPVSETTKNADFYTECLTHMLKVT